MDVSDPIQNLIDVAKTQLCRSDCLELGVGCCKPNLVDAIRAAAQQTVGVPISTDNSMPESEDILCVIWIPEMNDWEFGFWIEGADCWDCPDFGFMPRDKVTHYVSLVHPQRMPKN